jgi:mediator of replication checkpoint protein 1
MAPLDSDSDVLPEVGELVSEEQKKQDRAHVQKALLERKKKLLLAQQATKPAVSDDDDLEVVPAREIQAAVKEEEAERKSGKKRKHSEGRKRQLNLGGIGLERQRAKAASSKDEASPFIISSVSRLKGKKDSAIMTQGELNRTLVQRVVSVNRELTKKKEEEWVRRGGNVIDGGEGASSSANDASTAYAEKGLKVAEERGTAMEVDEDEGSDEEWTPEMRESASPSPQSDDGEHGDEETQAIEEEEEQEADITMVNPESEVLAMDDDFDEKQVLKVRTRRRVQAIVDSDSDGGNDENTFPIPKPKQHVFLSLQDHSNEDAIIPLMSHRGSLSSTDERTEDENDKENNTSLMFDRSEDKENKAVVRHGDASTKHPLGTRTSSLFGLEHGVARSLSLSPVLQSHDTDTDDEDDDNDDSRRPLKDLLDDDPFASQVKLSTSFTARLQQGSPATVLPLAASLATYMGKDGSYPQVLQEPSVVGGEPLQPAFSDLFESGTEKQTSTLFKRPDGGLSLSESFSDEVRTKSALLT